MARFISSIGQITGKLGGVVFKKRGNKTYISKIPAYIKPTNDPATKQRRKKFAWVGKFTRAVNSSPLLKTLWKSSSSRLVSAYNNIFQSVFGSIDSKDLSGVPIFVPGFLSFKLKSKSVLFGKSSIFIEAGALGHSLGIDSSVEKSILAVGVMVLDDPEGDYHAEEMFLPVQSPAIPLSLDNNLNFIISLSGRDLTVYTLFRTKKLYIVLVTLDSSGNPVRPSEIIS